MKLNEKTLIQYRNTEQTPDMEGILYKSEANKGFQKRWFTLRGNLLFYAEKKNDKEPIGVIIVEGCTIELAEEETEHFVFKLVFNDGVYCLGASSQLELEKWMKVRGSFLLIDLEVLFKDTYVLSENVQIIRIYSLLKTT